MSRLRGIQHSFCTHVADYDDADANADDDDADDDNADEAKYCENYDSYGYSNEKNDLR